MKKFEVIFYEKENGQGPVEEFINQADISKLENGTRNPSVNLLKGLADGMGMALKIEFIPKQKI